MRIRGCSIAVVLGSLLAGDAAARADAPQSADPPLFTEQEIFGPMPKPTPRPTHATFTEIPGWEAMFVPRPSLDEGIDLLYQNGAEARVFIDIRRSHEVDLLPMIVEKRKQYVTSLQALTRAWVAMDGSEARFSGHYRLGDERRNVRVVMMAVPQQPEYTIVYSTDWAARHEKRYAKALDVFIRSLRFE